MPQNLTDMTIEEISLVDDGANEDARVVIVKAKSGLPGHAVPGGDDPSNPDAAAMAAASIKEFQMDIETLSKALEDAEAKLAALEKRASDAEAALKDAEEVVKAKDAEIAEINKAKNPPSDEEVLKALPEAIRKRSRTLKPLHVLPKRKWRKPRPLRSKPSTSPRRSLWVPVTPKKWVACCCVSPRA